MNNQKYENFKIYVSTMNENIANKLKNSEEELNFYATLVNRFNEICEEKLRLKQQCKKQKEVIDKAINDIDLAIELIKQQPTEDDTWILNRLNGFKIILKEVSE